VPGLHNVRNVLAAAAVVRAAGLPVGAIREVAVAFAGVEHRLEHVRDVGGVSYLNDSIATSPERTVAALRALQRPVVLIAGGRSKHLPMAELASEIAARTRAVVTMGEMAEEIELAIADNGPTNVKVQRASSMDDAVRLARNLARPGDVVVLSPAGTSFDMFRDFEERGRIFKMSINRLAAEAS
jgi:UDP-N-acetylmuramoylalanine--D-glutamate ligase